MLRNSAYSSTTDPSGATVNVQFPMHGAHAYLTYAYTRTNGTGLLIQGCTDHDAASPTWTTVATLTAASGAGVTPWRGSAMRAQFASSTGSITLTADNGSGKTRFTSAAHGLATGDAVTLSGLSVSSGVIASVADDGAGHPRFADVGHGLVTGQRVTIAGTTSYNGTYVVGTVSDADHFDVDTISYVADETGTWTSDYNTTGTATVITADTFDVTTIVYGGDSTGTWTAAPGEVSIAVVAVR